MEIGDTLFGSLDSSFRTVRKVAKTIVILLFVFMPVTLRHLFITYIHVETVKAQREMTKIENQMMQSYLPAVPTTIPSRER